MTKSLMPRRSFLGALGGAIVSPALAQSAKPVIGVLMVVNTDPEAYLRTFREGLKERGYIDGQTISVEVHRTKPDQSDLAALAAELARRKVDVIVAIYTPAALAAKAATRDIPIVAFTGDMVGSGIVASLARPGGNITGITGLSAETGAARLDILRQIVPNLRRLALVLNETDPLHKIYLEHYELAGKKLGIEMLPFRVRPGEALEPVFARIVQSNADALWIQSSLQRQEVADLVRKNRLPTMGDARWLADNGGLMGYGPDENSIKRQLAGFVDRVLKGAKPADLPVQQPTKFEMVINLKTAKALGLTVPPIVLAQADEIIE